jgi:hypothetical protein
MGIVFFLGWLRTTEETVAYFDGGNHPGKPAATREELFSEFNPAKPLLHFDVSADCRPRWIILERLGEIRGLRSCLPQNMARAQPLTFAVGLDKEVNDFLLDWSAEV